MTGITGVSVYIPRYRLKRELIAQAWGGRPQPGSKVVSNFDEDALTMAQAAAWRVLADRRRLDRLYAASTSPPYWQRSMASQIAAACDLESITATADFGGSLRSGFSALRSGFEALDAGTASDIIVVASDRRDPEPETSEEIAFGDAAAAIRLGTQRTIANLVAHTSRSDDFLDEWRRDSDAHVHGYSSKYTLSRGYEANVVALGKALLAQAGVKASDIAVAAFNTPDPRTAVTCAKHLGIAPDRVCDGFSAVVGITGAAMPMLALAQALATARPDDLILAIGYGDGADGFILRCVTPAPPLDIAEPGALSYSSYPVYRKSRDFLREDSRGPEISNVLWKKEERQNVRLHGTKCMECGTMQFPLTRVCCRCRNTEGLLEAPLPRTGSVFTFTKDYLYDAPVQPTVMVVVDLDGGGRFLCQMTDCDEREVRIGIPVELVLRRMRESAQNHSYYWKCRPVKQAPVKENS